MPDRGGARHHHCALGLVQLRCLDTGRGGRAGGLHPCEGGLALPRAGRPFLDAAPPAGLLEGRRAQAKLARSAFEIEMEEALEHLVGDADVARQRSRLRVLSFLLARKVQERSLAFRHVRRSAVVRCRTAIGLLRELGVATDTCDGDRRQRSVADGRTREDRITSGASCQTQGDPMSENS